MLTDSQVRAAKPKDKAFKLTDGGGLYLQVTPSGGKHWRYEMMLGRIKGWQRVATRDDRCPAVFLSAICLAATVIFWL